MFLFLRSQLTFFLLALLAFIVGCDRIANINSATKQPAPDDASGTRDAKSRTAEQDAEAEKLLAGKGAEGERLIDTQEFFGDTKKYAVWKGDPAEFKKLFEECHKAVKVLTAVIAKFPDRDSYSCRANCHMALKMYDQAISDFLMAAKFSYSYRSLYIGKAANVLRVQKKYKEAITFYAASLKNSPNDFIPALLLGRALCFQELKRWNEAVQDYTEAIKVLTAPTYKGETKMLNLADSYFQRAKCYDNLGKASLAAADRRSHAKLSSSFANDFLSK